MQLDEDDLYDYDDQGSFDADAAVSDVISALKPVKISDSDAERALDKVDWDVDAAIASLKRQHQPKKPTSNPKTATQAASKAGHNPEGKLSALQRLALQRTQTDSANSRADSTNKATSKNIQAATKTSIGSATAPSLAQIAAQRKTDQKPTTGLSALDKLKARRKPVTGSSDSSKDSRSGKGDQALAVNDIPTVKPWSPLISYEPKSAALKPPSRLGAVIGSAGIQFFCNADTNSFVAREAKKAFSGPSPDEVVLSAQSKGFSATPTVKPISQGSGTQPKPSVKQKAVAQKSDAQKSQLAAKISNLNVKATCSFVVIGHVDAGKSTLMGRLLLDCGALSQKVVSRYEHESSKAGKSSFWLAWALDATKEERERGVTVDVGEAEFETKSTKFTVLDAPGHRDYVPNMIAGVAQADVAVLVVDSDTNAFESGFSLDGQTKEHAVLARSLGVDRIVVAVNKMDTQNWSQARFDDISTQLSEFLIKKVGFDAEKLKFVPTSGISGANVVSTGGPSWYKGPTLVSTLESFAALNSQAVDPVNDPARFLVSNAFVEPFQSTITTFGRLLSGMIEKGDVLDLVTQNRQATVKSLTNDADFLSSREVGGMKLQLDASGTSEEDSVAIRPGDVLASANAGLVATDLFIAKVQLFDIPRPILPGTQLAFHMGRVEDTVKVVKIIESLTKVQHGKKIRHLGKGAAARVELELDSAVVLTPPTVCKDLGRFVLRLNGATVGGGVVDVLLSKAAAT